MSDGKGQQSNKSQNWSLINGLALQSSEGAKAQASAGEQWTLLRSPHGKDERHQAYVAAREIPAG